jgi:hypothetical protein
LPRHALPTGSSETGFLVVDNRTKATINLTKECRPELEGLLRGTRATQHNSSDLICSHKAVFIRPGVTRLPIRFIATYFLCSQDPTGAAGTVRCVAGDKEPSLPAGDYEAHIDGGGAALPDPGATALHLTTH